MNILNYLTNIELSALVAIFNALGKLIGTEAILNRYDIMVIHFPWVGPGFITFKMGFGCIGFGYLIALVILTSIICLMAIRVGSVEKIHIIGGTFPLIWYSLHMLRMIVALLDFSIGCTIGYTVDFHQHLFFFGGLLAILYLVFIGLYITFPMINQKNLE